ncbi:hypothetical protein DPMN_055401 [Dreissena polymorpha]|uniref:Uncharacterized protein n=1 Tax=Dreissena polymorpha TaxID=45954 RepID=A0A9D4HSK0_DREPO|nr:hypothetical protein DPMN_055401 [Dreissena polymorpha]
MDLIRCFQCGIGLQDFSPADDPMIEHYQHANACLYLEAMFGVDKPPSSEGNNSDALSELKSSQCITFEARMKSFESSNFRCLKQPEQLAEAGFYFTGVGDEVRCFSCNGRLRNWKEHDDPWTEHGRWFPSCGFARAIKGEAFIERVQQREKICATQLRICAKVILNLKKQFMSRTNDCVISSSVANQQGFDRANLTVFGLTTVFPPL